MALVLLGGVAMAFALWLLGRPAGWWSRLWILLAVLAAIASVAALSRFAPAASVGREGSHAAWEPWSPERLAALRADGRPVLVNMTAAWCITCLANEQIALSSSKFHQQLDALIRFLSHLAELVHLSFRQGITPRLRRSIAGQHHAQ